MTSLSSPFLTPDPLHQENSHDFGTYHAAFGSTSSQRNTPVAAYQHHRPPLLTVNDNTSGLRQRRGAPPPRASLSMGIGGSYITPTSSAGAVTKTESPFMSNSRLSMLSPASAAWILVHGYSSRQQCEEIIRQFEEFGEILDVKIPVNSNWVALKYGSQLGVERAICHQHLRLKDGSYCGAMKLGDAESFFARERQERGPVGDWTGVEKSPSLTVALTDNVSAPLPTIDNNNTSEHPTTSQMTQDDILMANARQATSAPKRDICYDLLAWMYGW